MAGGPDRKIAYVDESMRVSEDGGIYLIAAAVIALGADAALERHLRTAAGRRRHRFHWHNESDKVRTRFLEVVACQPVVGVAAAVSWSTPRRQEKARESALWNLVPMLEDRGVTDLVLEARQEKLNRRDGRTLGSMQRCGIAVGMTHRFGMPSEEVLLWVADAFAGAAAAHVCGDSRHFEMLPSGRLTVAIAP